MTDDGRPPFPHSFAAVRCLPDHGPPLVGVDAGGQVCVAWTPAGGVGPGLPPLPEHGRLAALPDAGGGVRLLAVGTDGGVRVWRWDPRARRWAGGAAPTGGALPAADPFAPDPEPDWLDWVTQDALPGGVALWHRPVCTRTDGTWVTAVALGPAAGVEGVWSVFDPAPGGWEHVTADARCVFALRDPDDEGPPELLTLDRRTGAERGRRRVDLGDAAAVAGLLADPEAPGGVRVLVSATGGPG